VLYDFNAIKPSQRFFVAPIPVDALRGLGPNEDYWGKFCGNCEFGSDNVHSSTDRQGQSMRALDPKSIN
jgi:hypothetical protein